MADDTVRVTENEAAQQFQVRLGDALALLQYERRGGQMVITHTEVPDHLEGRGIGSALARAALDAARDRGAAVVPLCPFVRSYIGEHREYLSVVDTAYRQRMG